MENTANTYQFLETPAIYCPEMSADDWEDELRRMVTRSWYTREFLEGRLSPEGFEEMLFELGYNPIICRERWDEGLKAH